MGRNDCSQGFWCIVDHDRYFFSMRDHIRLRANTLSRMYLNEDYFDRFDLYPLLAHHAANYRASRDHLFEYEMDDE